MLYYQYKILKEHEDMAKSLVLAEKPSVARDIANVLKCNKKGNGFLEGDKYIVTWALRTSSNLSRSRNV